jgi:hypothetical protein
VNRDRQQAIQYIQAQPDGLWHWTEDGTVLVWADGTTIAFRAEIIKILEHLAPLGLPPFSALVVLLAAAREKFPDPNTVDLATGPDPKSIPSIASPSTAPANVTGTPPANLSLPSPPAGDAGGGGAERILLSRAFRWRAKTQFHAALEQIRMVAELPAELRSGLAARCLLAGAVFESGPRASQVDAPQILRGLAEPMTDPELFGEESGIRANSPPAVLARDLEMVANGLKPHTPASLALRMRTGLDALPVAPETVLPPAEQARRLIEELSRDRDCGVTARAARDLLAVVRLPRHLSQKEEMPLGGVSDITNRGPLDRLLLSELAHDDLTLSVRVALNEALYLRREPPWREPPGTLAVLLDAGVRLWGIPRVLAAAVALALVAQDRQGRQGRFGSQVLAWRAAGKAIQPINLLTRAGLVDHLSALATEAHVAAALPAFVAALPPEAAHQSVIITERAALEDPEFRQALDARAHAIAFVATVTREGQFELHRLPLARRPPVCQAELQLDKILEPGAGSASGAPSLKTEHDPDQPAIFGVRPFPFLLPITGRLDFWHQTPEQRTYAIMSDRRLIELKDVGFGGRILACELPAGRTDWMEVVDDVVYMSKASTTHRPRRLVSFPLPDGPIQVVETPSIPEAGGFHRCGDVLLVIGLNYVIACSLATGRELDRKLNAHLPIGGRFLRGELHYYVVGWNGEKIVIETLPLPAWAPFVCVRLVFDRRGLEGPWFLTFDGEVCSLADSTRIRLPLPGSMAPIIEATTSMDGHRLYVAKPERQWGYVMDLSSETGCAIQPGNLHRPLDLNTRPALPARNLYRVFEAIAILDDGLALRGRRNTWRFLRWERDAIRIVEMKNPPTGGHTVIPFGHEGCKTNRGGLLYSARWPGGGRAWLDSWGLLHLRGPDPAGPEVSLVLASGEVAGWTSDGHVCGPAFFFDGVIAAAPELVMERLGQFIRDVE